MLNILYNILNISKLSVLNLLTLFACTRPPARAVLLGLEVARRGGSWHTYIYIYIYIYSVCVYIYIYICISLSLYIYIYIYNGMETHSCARDVNTRTYMCHAMPCAEQMRTERMRSLCTKPASAKTSERPARNLLGWLRLSWLKIP